MNPVLTAASTVTCAHPPGTVRVTGSPRLTVAGAGVLTINGVQGAPLTTVGPLTTCGSLPQANPLTKKCASVLTVTGGFAPRLTVGGMPVLAQAGFAGMTDGVVANVGPQPGLTAIANQAMLTVG
ncbi:hypothetical protein [Actinocrispum sp. NPDC049592]|uniref:hypothetical protein n=1 Tax=Actinocrispum sp. NPDC049592 TaxID=3154835 RepID=UPI00341319BA